MIYPTEIPEYIPPPALAQIYQDWVNDISTRWLDFAPKEWMEYIDLENSFFRYKEYAQGNPEREESFFEWVATDGEARFMDWCMQNWEIQQKL